MAETKKATRHARKLEDNDRGMDDGLVVERQAFEGA
jgi:hypothetical protein